MFEVISIPQLKMYHFLIIFIVLGLIEEIHFRLATGKSSHWWMCHHVIVRDSKVLDQFNYNKKV